MTMAMTIGDQCVVSDFQQRLMTVEKWVGGNNNGDSKFMMNIRVYDGRTFQIRKQ